MNKNLIHEMAKIEDDYWWFKQKREFINRLIKKYKITKGNLLDCGCGTGKTLELLSNYGNVYGTDLDDDCIKYCKNRGFKNIYKKDILEDFKFKTKFNAIVTTDVLEHIEKDKDALDNLVHNLEDNGYLFITVPAHQWLFSYWDKELHHYRRYSYKSLKKLLQSNNEIEIKEIGYYNLLSFLPALFSRFLLSKIKQPESEFIEVPNWLNKVLIFAGIVDNFLATKLSVYFGLSLYAVVKKVK